MPRTQGSVMNPFVAALVALLAATGQLETGRATDRLADCCLGRLAIATLLETQRGDS